MKSIPKLIYIGLFAVSALFVFNSCEKYFVEYENVYSELLDIELEGQVGDPIFKYKDLLVIVRVYSEDYSAIEMIDITVSYGATTSIQAGETLDFSSSDEQDITITAEKGGSSKTYTIRMKKSPAPAS